VCISLDEAEGGGGRSFGVFFYEMITGFSPSRDGRPPLAIDDRTPVARYPRTSGSPSKRSLPLPDSREAEWSMESGLRGEEPSCIPAGVPRRTDTGEIGSSA
jgi:hypothetical protein